MRCTRSIATPSRPWYPCRSGRTPSRPWRPRGPRFCQYLPCSGIYFLCRWHIFTHRVDIISLARRLQRTRRALRTQILLYRSSGKRTGGTFWEKVPPCTPSKTIILLVPLAHVRVSRVRKTFLEKVFPTPFRKFLDAMARGHLKKSWHLVVFVAARTMKVPRRPAPSRLWDNCDSHTHVLLAVRIDGDVAQDTLQVGFDLIAGDGHVGILFHDRHVDGLLHRDFCLQVL